ncbi:hypothetical protein FRX31_006934 [Thalictrum thalictroides]|uniref:Uncharacterized protein n=1 Tax=Thalictrum thalictroides TaxID=46969 RepID=A0A7J6X1C6_THATH|nr:hypothetical protein FRX31_006934 [Thalictrum thalictroides]
MMRTINDLDIDALAHCASYLNLQDVSNMAMTSKYIKSVAYSDHIWQGLFSKRWPFQMSSSFLPDLGVKEAYLNRHIAVNQFKYNDPWSRQFLSDSTPYTHILIDKNDIILTQDWKIIMNIDAFVFEKDTTVTMRNHNARITCIRLFPFHENSVFRSDTQKKDTVLVTASCDHTIRLWWNGRSQRCFRGHNGPVTTLGDRLLGESSGKVFASGGSDGTVRLWSLNFSGKRGQHALKTTFYGHQRPISFLTIAGHKASLLVSISKDAKVRVWDATTPSLTHSSGCVGTTSAPVGFSGCKSREPVGMKCHESLIYVAAGSLVTAIDLRTMRYAFTSAIHPDINSFEMVPSKSLICTGGSDKAMLWDIRKSQKKPEPVTEFGQSDPVSHLHMDPYKVVTGSVMGSDINVWDPNTGMLLNSLKCYNPEDPNTSGGCCAMAVNGSRIVTASLNGDIRYKDYTHAMSLISSYEADIHSKFWEPQVDSYDSDD